jgi:hypothetical protein
LQRAIRIPVIDVAPAVTKELQNITIAEALARSASETSFISNITAVRLFFQEI